MRHVPLFTFVAASLAASAGVASTPASVQRTPATVVLQAANPAGCPVGFGARHAGQGGLVNVGPASARHREQGYRITFAPGQGRPIAQARITLRGVSGPHVMAAGEAPASGADAAQSFNVVPSSGSKGLLHSTVFTDKLTGVQWVELNDLTYADGTSWHATAATPCRIAPDGYMLVTAVA